MSNFPRLDGIDLNDIRETGIYIATNAKNAPETNGPFTATHYEITTPNVYVTGQQYAVINGTPLVRSRLLGDHWTPWMCKGDNGKLVEYKGE